MSIMLLMMMTVGISFGVEQNLEMVRSKYGQAVYSERICDELLSVSEKEKASNPILLAYHAALLGIKAKHAWNPYTKLSYVKEFEKEINEAVKKMPNDIEIRFLRYNIEVNIPAIVGLQKHEQEDLNMMYQLFLKVTRANADVQLLKEILEFTKEKNAYTQNQFLAMETKLKQLQ